MVLLLRSCKGLGKAGASLSMLVYNIVSCPTGFRCAMALLRTNSAHKLVQVMGQEEHGALVNLLYKSFKQELAFSARHGFMDHALYHYHLPLALCYYH